MFKGTLDTMTAIWNQQFRKYCAYNDTESFRSIEKVGYIGMLGMSARWFILSHFRASRAAYEISRCFFGQLRYAIN
jgi:hypothetical protein